MAVIYSLYQGSQFIVSSFGHRYAEEMYF